MALRLLSSCGMHGLSVVVAHGSLRISVVCSTWALSLRLPSSVVVARGLSCPVVRGILVPPPGMEPVSPALGGGFFTVGPPGSPSPPFSSWPHCLQNHVILGLFLKVYIPKDSGTTGFGVG